MDAKTLKEIITIEQVVELVRLLGSEPIFSTTSDNEINFETICHGGDSHKLYLYIDSKEFHCYSECGHMDVINLVEKVKGFSFNKAKNYICNVFGFGNFTMIEGFSDEEESTNLDWDILNNYGELETVTVDMERNFKYLDESILDRFYKHYHPNFYNDGIGITSLFKFGIRYDILNQRIIIPHRDEMGGLIAIRCRNLNEEMVEMGFKYMPITIDRKLLSAKTSKYLYGLDCNKDNIKRLKKVILLEAEKAVMQLDTILDNNNFGVALSSSSLSLIQVELLKELGVEEVIIALDKEYKDYGSVEEKEYAKRIKKGIINKLSPHFTVSIMWDVDNTLKQKQSPTDCGAGVFHKLYKNRIRVT